MRMIFFITSEQALDYVDDNAMVIVVDTNKPQMTECPELLKRSKMIAVLDHHRQSSNIIENAVLFLCGAVFLFHLRDDRRSSTVYGR